MEQPVILKTGKLQYVKKLHSSKHTNKYNNKISFPKKVGHKKKCADSSNVYFLKQNARITFHSQRIILRRKSLQFEEKKINEQTGLYESPLTSPSTNIFVIQITFLRKRTDWIC